MTGPAISANAILVGFLCVRDRGRAREFYTRVLGLQVIREDQFALVLEVGANTLRISQSDSFKPQPFTVAGWEVEDISGVVDALAANGVGFRRFQGLDQDERGIWLSPSTLARIAWYEDPDGNLLSVSQHPAD
jgi:catechol 2,3-dioxygenase-like lactoylglutathione lyase family enzyme